MQRQGRRLLTARLELEVRDESDEWVTIASFWIVTDTSGHLNVSVLDGLRSRAMLLCDDAFEKMRAVLIEDGSDATSVSASATPTTSVTHSYLTQLALRLCDEWHATAQ
jgi:hypothetical protein